MVVPITMFYPESPIFYQQGVHVGVMGMYAGVGRWSCSLASWLWILWNYFLIRMSLMQSNHTMYFIHNHFSFVVKYNKVAHTDLARIVAFEVIPYRWVFIIHPWECRFFVDFCMILDVIFHFVDTSILSYIFISAAVLHMNLMGSGRGTRQDLKPVIHSRDVLL